MSTKGAGAGDEPPNTPEHKHTEWQPPMRACCAYVREAHAWREGSKALGAAYEESKRLRAQLTAQAAQLERLRAVAKAAKAESDCWIDPKLGDLVHLTAEVEAALAALEPHDLGE